MLRDPTPDAEGRNQESSRREKSSHSAPHEVLLVSKRDCPLCAEARRVLLQVRLRYPFEWAERLIDDDPELALRHELEVPVIFLDGRQVCFWHVDVERLEALLRSPRA